MVLTESRRGPQRRAAATGWAAGGSSRAVAAAAAAGSSRAVPLLASRVRRSSLASAYYWWRAGWPAGKWPAQRRAPPPVPIYPSPGSTRSREDLCLPQGRPWGNPRRRTLLRGLLRRPAPRR
eukprot:SM000179S03391  [mRNA]  locus=s179:7499:12100:+ [translate_table: standard]